MTKQDIRDKYFGYNEDITKLDKLELLKYINFLEENIVYVKNVIDNISQRLDVIVKK
jgi:hypothetical protein